MQGGTLPLCESPLFGRVWSPPRWKSALLCQCFVSVSGRRKDAAWLELYIQQDTAYTKTCQNCTVDVGKWSAGHHRIFLGHSECQLLTKDFKIPTDLRRSFILTVECSVPLLEGLELAVKDDELPPYATSSDLNHHCHMGIAGFGFTIATCLVLIGCGVGILRRRFSCKTSAQPL